LRLGLLEQIVSPSEWVGVEVGDAASVVTPE